MTRHYLDHNATAPVHPDVIDAVAAAMAREGNPLSVHEEGRAARKALEQAREQVRALVNAPVNGVIFTSGGTESIHLALHGAAAAHKLERIFYSAIEHSAVAANAETTGVASEVIPVTGAGIVDLDALRRQIRQFKDHGGGAFLVALMVANNETGVIQPVAEAAAIVHEYDGVFFADAAQAVGKIPVNFVMSGADILAFTGHKFGGPLGVGALVAGPNFALAPQLRGGGQEENRRASTHNGPAIVGLGVACAAAKRSLARADAIAALRDRMEAAAMAAGAVVWGRGEDRLPGTLCLSAPGFPAELQLMTMDLAGLAISAGSACSSGKAKPSHVLTAMGADGEAAKCAIRVSVGWNSTSQDADAFIREWPAAYEKIKSRSRLEGAA